MSTQCANVASSGKMSPKAALWLNGLILLSFLAASTAPSPLYSIYRETWGFSALTLTVIFSSYAIALLAALLVFGALSSYVGRRAVIVASLALELGAMFLFETADSVGWLLAARILQGVATGMVTGALAAALIDLHPQRGALVNAVAPMIGLGIGALGTAALIQWAPAPTQLVYVVLLLVFAFLATAAFFLPETATQRSGAWASLKPSFEVPPAARSMMWKLVPINTALWALGGFNLSLGPTLAQMVTGNTSALIGGVLIAVMTFSNAAGIILGSRRAPLSALAQGAVTLTVGIAISLTGIYLLSGVLLFFGTAVSGFGFGMSFISSIRCLVPLATPAERAGLMAAFYVASYLAFSLPVIALGLFAGPFGLQHTAIAYGLVLILMTVAAIIVLKLRNSVPVVQRS